MRFVITNKKGVENLYDPFYICIKIFKGKNEILSDRYHYFEFNTFNKTFKNFCLNITDDYINLLCAKNNYVHTLESLKKNKLLLPENYCNAMRSASWHGHINVLEWWKNSGLKLYYDDVFIIAAIYNHDNAIKVLEWFKNSGLPIESESEWVLNYASAYNNINILEWWKNSGLPLKYDENAIGLASSKSHIGVLEWWKNSGLELKYDNSILDDASMNGHINVLEWWKNSGLPLKYSQNLTTTNYADNVKEWWKNSGLPIN